MGLSIRKIVDKITEGEIRIPSFQRGFVWEPEKVAFLMDSIYKGYPFGSILLWKTREKLDIEKKLGQFSLPEPKAGYPIDYVLDGQQRITSLFTVFQTDLKPEDNSDWLDVYFDLSKGDSIQDSVFVALPPDGVDYSKHFPLNVLFDSVRYRLATEGLEKSTQQKIDKLQEIFKEVAIPVVELETENKEKVAIVFERINRTGIPLSSYELLSAWTWSSDFDLQNELDKLKDELEPTGFADLLDDQDLLLKCCAGVLNKETTPAAVMDLHGSDVRSNFVNICNGIKSAIDFLRAELNVYNLKYIPFPSMLVPLAVFFASDKTSGALFNSAQKQQLTKWFWRSCYSRRYSSGVNEAHRIDIEDMEKLKVDSLYNISNKIKITLNESFFTSNQFNINTVNTKTFVLTLASNSPKSFISGANVDLSTALKKASNVEFHHIFPDKHLDRLGISRDKRYQLANFCFLNSFDNQKIKDSDPKNYKSQIDLSALDSILQHAICPNDALDLDFDTFINKRTKQLVKYIVDNLV